MATTKQRGLVQTWLHVTNNDQLAVAARIFKLDKMALLASAIPLVYRLAMYAMTNMESPKDRQAYIANAMESLNRHVDKMVDKEGV